MREGVVDETQAVILCVDDEKDLREMVAEELEDAGYVVLQAANGRDALKRLDECCPDLILCDIAMPVMDGYELLHLIRETRADLSAVPFVFLTAQDALDQITQGKYAGADDYLVKPISFDLMLATIAARLRQMRRVHDKSTGEIGRSVSPAGTGSRPGVKTFTRLTRMFNLIAAGVVLLDRNGRIQFANISAQRLMCDSTGPIAMGMVSTDGIQSLRASPSVILAAVDAGLHGREYTEFLSLPNRKGQRSLLVTVCALDCVEIEDEGPAAVLFICGANRDEPAPLKALESHFRLTPTEGRVAWAFAQGLRPEKIAENFDISVTTVAFHKRNIFQKTRTNRQADLIALLLTLPASADA